MQTLDCFLQSKNTFVYPFFVLRVENQRKQWQTKYGNVKDIPQIARIKADKSKCFLFVILDIIVANQSFIIFKDNQ